MTEHTPPVTIPVSLSGQLTATITNNAPHDVLLGGLPFLLYPSTEDPWVRDTTEDRKEQFDNSGEAGENSFGLWWLRSQATFHGGAGQLFLDSAVVEGSRTRFHTSIRADVHHEAGEVRIVNRVIAHSDTGRKGVEQVTWSAVQKLATMSTSSDQVHVYNLPSLNLGTVNVSLAEVGQVPVAMTSDGENIFVAINGKIKRIAPGGTVTHTHNMAYTGVVTMGFAKQRLIVTSGNKLFELDPSPATPPVTVDINAPFYTNPSTQWRYTAVADGPSGIYVAGFSGPRSELSLMTVGESGGSLVMRPPVVQVALPPGEVINDVMFYINSFFGLATSAGFRVGGFTAYGALEIGPLSFEGVACRTVSGAGSRFYVGGGREVWSVDLSAPLGDSGRYSSARLHDGQGTGALDFVNDLTALPFPEVDNLYFTTSDNLLRYDPGGGVPSPEFVKSAVITTSWARFSTVEPKQLHYVRIDGSFPKPVQASDPRPARVRVESLSGSSMEFVVNGGPQTSYEFSTASLPVDQAFRLVITLQENGSGQDHGIRFNSYQLKAMAAPKMHGEIVLPLLLQDHETDLTGRKAGYEGYACDRLAALEEMAKKNLRITVVDTMCGESYPAVIRRVQYRQDLKPTRVSRVGGTVSVILQRV